MRGEFVGSSVTGIARIGTTQSFAHRRRRIELLLHVLSDVFAISVR